MTRKQQRHFVRELISAVHKEILAKLPNVPEEWDGHELRQLIADHFQASSFTLRQWKRRLRDYRNAVIVNNLV